MKVGDLVHVHSATDSEDCGFHYFGIYVGWDNLDEGWQVLTGGKIQTFITLYWSCKKV